MNNRRKVVGGSRRRSDNIGDAPRAGVVWHGAPAGSVEGCWQRSVMDSRATFETEVRAAVDQHEDVGVVLTDLGLVQVGPSLRAIVPALEQRVRAQCRPEDVVGIVGEDQVAVLVTGVGDTELAALADRVAGIFDEPLVLAGREHPLRLHGTVVWVRGRGDLLWQAFYENAAAVARAHHLVFTEGIWGLPGMGVLSRLEDVAAAGDVLATSMGMEAIELDVPAFHGRLEGGELPQRAPSGEVPIRLDGHEAGTLRLWFGPDATVPHHPLFYSGLSAALSEVGQRLIHVEQLAAAATTDPLTGLLNRRGLEEQLDGLDGSFAIALVDIDDFKAVNTRLGLAGGDEVLVAMADVLREGRDQDLVARWGGEEFLLVLPDTSLDGAAGRLMRMLAASRERVSAGGQPVTFSCGIAVGTPDGFDAVVADADERLRRAKAEGKARVLFE